MRDRRRAVPAVLTGVSIAVVVAVTALATPAAPRIEIAQSGHWVADKTRRTVLHMHGEPPAVDARVTVPDDVTQGSIMTLQGATEGFVVGRDGAWSFDKSTLEATATATLPGTGENPVGIEAPGGPYLVYRAQGTIVRLGQPPVVLEAGGPVGPPVHTPDGTVWVHRADNGTLCAVRRDALEIDCNARLSPGKAGGITIVAGQAVFIDTTGDVAHLIRAGDQGDGAALGTDLPADALFPDQSTTFRLPVVLPGTTTLRLLDSSGVTEGRAADAPIDVALGQGTFSSPLVSGDIVALLESTASTLSTFDATGRRIADLRLPPGTEPSDARRGEDGRIYVDQPDGSRTDVVQSDGTISSLDLGPGTRETVAGAAPASQVRPVAPPPPGELIAPPIDPTAATAPTPGGPVSPNPGPADGGTATGPGTGPGDNPPTDPIVPAPPVQVLAALEADGTVTVTWADGGGGTVDLFTVTSSRGDTAQVNAGRAAFPALLAGDAYTFTVVATNEAGTSAPSVPSNPVTIPQAPQQLAPDPPANLAVSFTKSGPDSGTASVTWTTPDLHGGTLVRYEVTPPSTPTSTVATSVQLTAPAEFDCSGPATFRVRTVASVGGVEQTSPYSETTLATGCPVTNSRMYLSPASATLRVGESITLTAMLAIGSRPVNAAQADFAFPTDVFRCVAAEADPSWDVFPEAGCSGGSGRVVVGKIPPPRTGTVAIGTITFTALAPGTTTVSLTSESMALAHDGSDDTVDSRSGGTYTVTQ